MKTNPQGDPEEEGAPRQAERTKWVRWEEGEGGDHDPCKEFETMFAEKVIRRTRH